MSDTSQEKVAEDTGAQAEAGVELVTDPESGDMSAADAGAVNDAVATEHEDHAADAEK